MIKTQFFCDICGKEYEYKEGAGEIRGVLVKMTSELKRENYPVGGNYCGDCFEIIIKFLASFKNERSRPDNNPKPADKS